MQKKNKPKGKFNFFDFFVIGLILLCIVSFSFRALTIPEWEDKYHDKSYRLYFEIDDIRSSSFAFFENNANESVYLINAEGEKIYLGTLGNEIERGRAFKTVSEVNSETLQTEIKKYYYPESDDDSLYSESRCSIKGYIDVLGKVTDTAFLMSDRVSIFFGDEIEIATEHITAIIKVTGIYEI